VVALVAAICLQSPSIDRSAEAALKDVFARAGSLKQAHIHMEAAYFAYVPQRWDAFSSADFWIGDGHRFRYVDSQYRQGGGSTFVSDGLVLLSDAMSDDVPVTLSLPKKTFGELNAEEPFLYFLDGPAGFDAIVDKDKGIVFVESKDTASTVIEFHSAKLSSIRVSFNPKHAFPDRIEVFNAPWWAEADNPYPGQPFSREDFTLSTDKRLNFNLFRIIAPIGQALVDTRKK